MKDILRSLLHGSPGQGTRHHKLTGEFIGVLEGDGRKPFSTDGTFFFRISSRESLPILWSRSAHPHIGPR